MNDGTQTKPNPDHQTVAPQPDAEREAMERAQREAAEERSSERGYQ